MLSKKIHQSMSVIEIYDKGRLTLWHGLVGVGFIPSDKVGQVGQAGVVFKAFRDERLQYSREFVV